MFKQIIKGKQWVSSHKLPVGIASTLVVAAFIGGVIANQTTPKSVALSSTPTSHQAGVVQQSDGNAIATPNGTGTDTSSSDIPQAAPADTSDSAGSSNSTTSSTPDTDTPAPAPEVLAVTLVSSNLCAVYSSSAPDPSTGKVSYTQQGVYSSKTYSDGSVNVTGPNAGVIVYSQYSPNVECPSDQIPQSQPSTN